MADYDYFIWFEGIEGHANQKYGGKWFAVYSWGWDYSVTTAFDRGNRPLVAKLKPDRGNRFLMARKGERIPVAIVMRDTGPGHFLMLILRDVLIDPYWEFSTSDVINYSYPPLTIRLNYAKISEWMLPRAPGQIDIENLQEIHWKIPANY